MGAILTIQLSAFSNKKISPSMDNIAIIMPKLKEISGFEFLPNIIYSQKIDFTTGKVDNVPNLSFSTTDNTGQVICTDNRIDCNFNFLIENQNGINERFEKAADIIKFIMVNDDVFANRLALNVTFLSNVCNGESAFETQVLHVVPFYQKKKIKEWSSRTNAEGKMTINGIEEDLNIITEYTRATEKNTKETRIMCHADINTIAENSDFRFKDFSIVDFAKNAKSIFEEIRSDLEELVPDGK